MRSGCARPGAGRFGRPRCPAPGRGDVVVRTLRSGVSRGTETLVFRGGVPPSQYAAMRAPFQEGDFPGPVKYGYLNVGVVEQGPPALRGRTVFCLYPHQTAYVVPAGAVSVVPDDVPPARAVLAGTRRDGRQRALGRRPLVGDRVASSAPAWSAAASRACWPASPASTSRSSTSTRHAPRSPPRSAPASRGPTTRPAPATSSCTRARRRPGCSCSLDLLAPEGTVLDLSWYGDAEVRLSLGGAFHAGRLGLRASQVGTVSPARSARRTYGRPLALALELLRDPAFDVLVTGESRFDELPAVMARLAAGSLPALCHTITYDGG